MTDEQPSRRTRIPDFASRQEEAEFWDTHDFTEFLDETEPVTLRVSPNLRSVFSLRLDREDQEELARQAKELGVGPSTLARMWIKERLRQGRTQQAEPVS
jgi:hypothetical protein